MRETLEAGDVITLVFGKGVTGLTAFDASAVVGEAGAIGAVTAPGEIAIDAGFGTFLFTPGSVSTTSGVTTATMVVATGTAVPKDSSFDLIINAANLDKTKLTETTVSYSAVSGITGGAKDVAGNNTGNFIKTADQVSASVKTKLNAVIVRDGQAKFDSGNSDGATGLADTLVITVKDNQNLLAAASSSTGAAGSVTAGVEATVTVFGDFSKVTTAPAPVLSGTAGVSGGATGANVSAGTISADKKSMSFSIAAAAAGIAGEYTFTLTNDVTGTKISAEDYSVSVSYDASVTSLSNTKAQLLDVADAGKWIVDATIVNVPYFPVGFEGTDSSIHFANLNSAAVDVIVSGIDGDGEKYGPVNLGADLAKNTVTKVSQTKIMELFELTAATKLSVTFNIDATAGTVNAYAYTQKATQGRTEISTTQQHGVK